MFIGGVGLQTAWRLEKEVRKEETDEQRTVNSQYEA